MMPEENYNNLEVEEEFDKEEELPPLIYKSRPAIA
jgi:hypothetical protein